MNWTMSVKQKETANIAGDWLYRGVAIYFLWNIYTDVQNSNKTAPVFQERLDRHELRLNNIEQNMFAPVWEKNDHKKQSSYQHQKDTKFLIEYTEANLASLNALGDRADSLLSHTQNN